MSTVVNYAERFEGGSLGAEVTEANTIFDYIDTPTNGEYVFSDVAATSGLSCFSSLEPTGTTGGAEFLFDPLDDATVSTWHRLDYTASGTFDGGTGFGDAAASLLAVYLADPFTTAAEFRVVTNHPTSTVELPEPHLYYTSLPPGGPITHTDVMALPTSVYLKLSLTFSASSVRARVSLPDAAPMFDVTTAGTFGAIQGYFVGLSMGNNRGMTSPPGLSYDFLTWTDDVLVTTEGGETCLRNYPRDDALGFGGVARNYPPPRGRRNIGGQP